MPDSVAVGVQTDRWCVVGAGPAGLVMSRAFRENGVPHDVFERHDDVGGIWDMTNTGTPMYRSAHFISSKTTSGFAGFPMPEHYPDYPSNREILDYIRAFARVESLYENITFSTAVTSCEPLENDRWRVTLSSGEVRDYAGIVCCNGVTWTPNMPTFVNEGFIGEIAHASTYKSPETLENKRVVIVGLGNSGADIACDAARVARRAFISVRRGYHFIPKHVFGMPVDIWSARASQGDLPDHMLRDVGDVLATMVGDITRFGLPAPDHEPLQSHPLLNTELLIHLGHGRVIAKPDIARLEGDNVIFKDGSAEPVDLVLCATGYKHAIPYIDAALLPWSGARPQLYLNMFSREHPTLTALGFLEVASAAYQLFGEMAAVIASAARDRATAPEKAALFAEHCRTSEPDLRGDKGYISTDRHANYVNLALYHAELARLRAEFGWARESALAE